MFSIQKILRKRTPKELIQNLETSINDLEWNSESLQLEKEALEKELKDKENEACQMRSEIETIKTSSEQKLKELSDTTNSRAEARALAMSKTLENKLKEKENECDQKLSSNVDCGPRGSSGRRS